MKHISLHILVTLLTFSFSISASAYSTFSDPKTGYEFFKVNSFRDGSDTISDIIKNNGLHLATRIELEVLFADLGPYTKAVAEETGYTFSSEIAGPEFTFFVTPGVFDSGMGNFGFAMGSVIWDTVSDRAVEGGDWLISDTYAFGQYLDPTFGLWAVSRYGTLPVPEPSTLLLSGIGLAGVGLARRKSKSTVIPV